MRFQVQYVLSDQMMVRSTSYQSWNAKFLKAAAPLLLILVCAITLIQFESHLDVGEFAAFPRVVFWFVLVLLLIMLLGQAIGLFSLYLARRSLRQWCANLKDPTIRWTIEDTGITTAYDHASRLLPWKEFQQMRVVEELLILDLQDKTRLCIPVELIPLDIQQWVQQQIPTC